MHLLTDEQKQEIYANAKSNKALLEGLGCGDGKALDKEDEDWKRFEKQKKRIWERYELEYSHKVDASVKHVFGEEILKSQGYAESDLIGDPVLGKRQDFLKELDKWAPGVVIAAKIGLLRSGIEPQTVRELGEKLSEMTAPNRKFLQQRLELLMLVADNRAGAKSHRANWEKMMVKWNKSHPSDRFEKVASMKTRYKRAKKDGISIEIVGDWNGPHFQAVTNIDKQDLNARISMSYQAGWNACEAENKYLNNVEAKEVIRKEREDLIKQGWKSPVECSGCGMEMNLELRQEVAEEERKKIGKHFEGLYNLLNDFVWTDKTIKEIILPKLAEKIESLKQGKEIT